jgi:hypothetical protein
MNFITDFPLSVKESYIKAYNTILIAVCKFIKFVIYIPIRKDIDIVKLINLLLRYIIEIYKYL